ncbi:unnamed protein product [Coccothraustes coccothraustes]
MEGGRAEDGQTPPPSQGRRARLCHLSGSVTGETENGAGGGIAGTARSSAGSGIPGPWRCSRGHLPRAALMAALGAPGTIAGRLLRTPAPRPLPRALHPGPPARSLLPRAH